MMRGIWISVTVGLFVIALAAPSFGLDRREQRSVYVSAGREARIASYGAPDDACKAGPEPEIVVTERPSYGTLIHKPVRIVAEPSGLARRNHPCIGKFIDAIAIYYRPVAGFRGSDRMRLQVKFAPTPLVANVAIVEEEIFINVR